MSEPGSDMKELGRDRARTGDELNSVRIGDGGGGGTVGRCRGGTVW
jgi:hypothetical protein